MLSNLFNRTKNETPASEVRPEDYKFPTREKSAEVREAIETHTEINPKLFIKEGLSHQPKTALELLELNDLAPGTKVLDIGSGRNELVTLLRERGIEAYGLDLDDAEGDIQPDVIGTSEHLPFPDNSMDVVVDFWGGLTYPLEGSETLPPEEQKEAVITFLNQLKEALRVSSESVRIHPMGLQGCFELSGMVMKPSDKFKKDTNILRINIKIALVKAGVEYIPGKTAEINDSTVSPVVETGIFRKNESYDPSQLDELINKVINLSESMWILGQEIQKTHPLLYKQLQTLNELQGIWNSIDQRGPLDKDSLHLYSDALARNSVDIENVYTRDPELAQRLANGVNKEIKLALEADINASKSKIKELLQEYSSDLHIA